MSIGLNRTDFEQLRRSGMPDAYPKPTLAVVQELNERGYAVDVTVLNYLVKTARVQPSRVGQRNFSWQAEQIDAVASILEEQQSFLPAVVASEAFGFPFATYLKALKQAVEQLRIESGDPTVAEDPTLFVMHVAPPRFGRPARVSFTVCDDVRAHLCPQESGNLPFGVGTRTTTMPRVDDSAVPPAHSPPVSPAVHHRNGMAFSAK
ncbi:MAG: hypothetical protein NT069_14095 [Planctomycetota bacterium]|nr:hypothetical protein [Planctomycetota bacterium]